jgi:hypothetical protein
MLRRAVARPAVLIAILAAAMGYLVARPEVCPTCQPPAATRVIHPWTVANPTRDRDFRGWQFVQAGLAGVTFDHCDFRGADLTGADLSQCRLRECDFTGARLDGTDLRGVVFDRLTVWPEGFDPRAHGARLEE